MAAPRRTADSRSRLGNHLVCFRDLLYGAPAPRITLDSADRNSHALREEEIDLSFADFDGVGRPKTAQLEENKNREASNTAERLARREGLEPPTLRFEERRKGKK